MRWKAAEQLRSRFVSFTLLMTFNVLLFNASFSVRQRHVQAPIPSSLDQLRRFSRESTFRNAHVVCISGASFRSDQSSYNDMAETSDNTRYTMPELGILLGFSDATRVANRSVGITWLPHGSIRDTSVDPATS